MKKQIEIGHRARKQHPHNMSGMMKDLAANLTPSNRQAKSATKSLGSDIPFASYQCGCGFGFTCAGEGGRTDIKIRLHKKVCEIARTQEETKIDDKIIVRNKSGGDRDFSSAGRLNLAVMKHGGVSLDFQASKIAGVPQESLESIIRKDVAARK
jgi:hypothetical protein